MSHIVIHDDSSDVTHYAEFDDLQAAASYLEDLANQDAVGNARLFALAPVEFAVKSYVKVEIGKAAVDSSPETTEEVASETADAAAPAAGQVFTDAPFDDTVEYVEASMAPADGYVPSPIADRLDDSGESRRGLFGR